MAGTSALNNIIQSDNLKKVVSNAVDNTVVDDFSIVSEGKKVLFSFKKYLVENMRKSNVPDKDILDVILILDEGIENGNLTDNDILNLVKKS